MELLTTAIREEKEVKEIQIGKEVKVSLFADDLREDRRSFKHATRKLLELNNEFGKVVGYKINTQKSVAFLYTKTKGQKEKSNKQSHLPSHLKE